MKRTAFCVTLTLCAIFLVGCAAQVQSKTQAPNSAQAELPQVRGTDNAAEAADTPLLPAEGKATETDAVVESSKSTPQTDDSADKAAEKQPASGKTAPPAAPKEPAIPAPAPEDKPAPTPTPAPTQKPAEKQGEQPAPKPEPAPTPKPAASGNIYSIAEAIRAGNEYAKAQYGVTIDTDLTAENASYFPGTADSVAWLAANGGQEALNRAVRGNVDATFQYLAAMDSADAVRAYARFNCTVRYSAALDEYIVVVLYG